LILKKQRNSFNPESQASELHPKKIVAGQEGFEPPTPGFGVRCSTVRATGLHIPMRIW
jgi:hypothetical protein